MRTTTCDVTGCESKDPGPCACRECYQKRIGERDEAIKGMNHNADLVAKTAAMCREARHVADLAIAVLKTFDGERWDGIQHFVRAIEGRYSWVKTGKVDYQPEAPIEVAAEGAREHYSNPENIVMG